MFHFYTPWKLEIDETYKNLAITDPMKFRDSFHLLNLTV